MVERTGTKDENLGGQSAYDNADRKSFITIFKECNGDIPKLKVQHSHGGRNLIFSRKRIQTRDFAMNEHETLTEKLHQFTSGGGVYLSMR